MGWAGHWPAGALTGHQAVWDPGVTCCTGGVTGQHGGLCQGVSILLAVAWPVPCPLK